MPANLTQQYLKAEDAYRRAGTPEEELQCLENMLRELPKHKGTDKLQAELKQKISKAKKEAAASKAAGKKGKSFRIPRQGAGRAVLLGGPNGGKSSLLAALTRAQPEIADYPFTTREPQPGMMPWEDVMVQLLDTPPITADYFEPYMQGLIRGADLALLVVDLGSDEGIEQCQEVLAVLGGTKTRLGSESYLDENDIGRSYTRTFLVGNKIDDPEARDRWVLLHEFEKLEFPELLVSAKEGAGLDELRERIYRSLDVVRVYTKTPTAKEADFDKPFTVRRGGTVLDIAELVHKDVAAGFKFARVWGESVHPGEQVKGDYEVHDKDIVEIHAS